MGGPGTKLSDQTLDGGNGIVFPDTVSLIAAYNIRPFASKVCKQCVHMLNLIGVQLEKISPSEKQIKRSNYFLSDTE